MNWIAKTLTIVGTGVVLTGNNLSAVIPDKYQTILDRNAFGLVPPPAVVDTNTLPPTPINLKLTGFATIGGVRRAYFTIPPKDAKDTQQYINLSENEREGTLEVVTIAESEGEVRIKNGGTDMVMSLEKDGFKPAKLAPGMTPAPMPMANPAGQVSPVFNPGTSSAVAPMPTLPPPPPFPQPGIPGQPNQSVPQPAYPGQPNIQQQQANGQPAPDSGERTIPTRTVRTLRVPPVPQPQNEMQAPEPQ